MVDRITLNPPEDHKKYGEVDEVVFSDCTAHLEQLDKGHWYLGLYRGDEMIQIWLHRDGKSVKATFQTEGATPTPDTGDET